MRVIGDLSRLNAIRYPKKIALRMGEQTLTYEELNARSNQLAHALIALGVEPGDRIALLACNRLDYAIITQGVAKCGAILAPMNFRLAPQEIATVLRDCEPKLLFTEPAFGPSVKEAVRDSGPPLIFLPDEGDPIPNAQTLQVLCEGRPASAPAVEVSQESTCVIMYTSGTTGTPKGVLVSHEVYFRMYLATAVEASLRQDDVYLMAVPMFHAAGLNMMLHQALFMGASGVIHRGTFEPDTILKIIQDYRITLAILVPTTVGILAFHPNLGSYDVSSLDKIFYGSMPITPRILDQAMKVFPRVAFTQFYGSTESGMLGVLRWADHGKWSQTTGRQALLSEMKIVDDDGKPVPVGGVGEVIGAKRTMGMIGYWRNEKATAETIRDGWIYTGDLARQEQEGFFTLVDRRKDLIISGGENIYPKEVENVLAAHPAVREAAVFSLPHELYGESVCAAVSLFPGQAATSDELVAFCRGKIAGYKIPRRLEILPALPRNASDKVQKAALKARFSGA